jgi:hypothetical protein
LSYEYFYYNSIPETDVLNGILKIHKDIFGSSDDLINKMICKPKLLVQTAMDDNKVIGYKIGYEMDKNKFYSWLGGVDTKYRKQGIA